MKNGMTRFILFATFLAGASGVALFWMKYLLDTTDVFSVVHHPWQPWMLKAHVLAAPVFLFALGMVTLAHVKPHLSSRTARGRWSGWGTILAVPVAVASGYGIQVVTAPPLLSAARWVHIVSSFLFLVCIGVHYAGAQSRREELQAAARASSTGDASDCGRGADRPPERARAARAPSGRGG